MYGFIVTVLYGVHQKAMVTAKVQTLCKSSNHLAFLTEQPEALVAGWE